MSELFLSRARLRADITVQAIAPLLLPPDRDARLLAAHRLVWSLMADAPDRTRDFLWREERQGAFLILAPRPAAEGAGLFDVENKPWQPMVRAGDRLGFVLRANPTVARGAGRNADGASRRGKRSDVVMDALHGIPRGQRAAARPDCMVQAGRDWLTRQGMRAGFAPETEGLQIDGYDTVHISRDGAPAVAFGRLEFGGVLEVTDPLLFIPAVAAGFGRSRAFGCGLMLLRRP